MGLCLDKVRVSMTINHFIFLYIIPIHYSFWLCMCKIICGSGFLIVFHIAFIITQMEKKINKQSWKWKLIDGVWLSGSYYEESTISKLVVYNTAHPKHVTLTVKDFLSDQWTWRRTNSLNHLEFVKIMKIFLTLNGKLGWESCFYLFDNNQICLFRDVLLAALKWIYSIM